MTEIELYNELQNIEGCLKMADSQISELRKKKNDIMNDFLSLLPFQKGDKVKDKDGNCSLGLSIIGIMVHITFAQCICFLRLIKPKRLY